MKRSFLVCLLALSAWGARAHDRWADGSAVPAWVKAQCCGPREVHHLTSAQVHRLDAKDCWPGATRACWRIDGYPYPIPDDAALPSQDGDYWAFYAEHETSCAPEMLSCSAAQVDHFSPMMCLFATMTF